VDGGADRAHVRLAELVAALSLGVDLGFGQPMEHVLRQCLIAMRLAERAGLGEAERAVVYYTALLVNVGCHTDAHEQAKWFGDDIALKSGKYDHEPRSLQGAAAGLRRLGAGHAPLARLRLGLEFAVSGRREVDRMIDHHAAMARRLAEQLALPEAVRDAVSGAYEQWDGRGWPGEHSGDAIPIAARLVMIADYAEVAHRVGGTAAARTLARRRAGRQFDPALAELFAAEADSLLPGLDSASTWEAVIDAEPALAVVASGERFDAALTAIANFVDLKSPFTLGHAVAVSALAAAAARRAGLDDEGVRTLRRAGLVHDLGRLGVSNAIWDKPGPLGSGEWERVRLHPHLTERMLRPSPPASSAPPTRTRRSASRAPIGSRARPARRPASCGPRSRRGGWTPTRSRRCGARPGIACGAGAAGRRA
jgi:HD-GYP domain-containing protein (c-di-GMP phosphodiesterase class II)